MSKKTKIEWTEATWNPVTGCTKVSAMSKVGKKSAGRFLDDIEHNGYPS